MIPPFLAQLETAARTASEMVDHAADKDLRWYLVAIVGLVLFACGGALYKVAQYFAGKYDEVSKRLDAVQDAQIKYLQEDRAQLIAAVQTCTSTVSHFAAMLGSVKHLFLGERHTQPGGRT